MLEQDFQKLVSELKLDLKRIARRGRFLGFIDSDDLYQEALINLWSRLEKGEFMDKTRSYIVKSCYFHIQNYIRTHKLTSGIVSLDEPVVSGEEGSFCLKDVMVDNNREDLFNQLNNHLIAEEIMNNGLTKREKDVFKLLYEGLNLREAACRLGISHVRVLKIKQNICLKYKDRFFDSGVTKERSVLLITV